MGAFAALNPSPATMIALATLNLIPAEMGGLMALNPDTPQPASPGPNMPSGSQGIQSPHTHGLDGAADWATSRGVGDIHGLETLA